MRNKDAIFDLAVEYGCEPQSSDEGQYWFEQHYRADEFLEELKKRYPGKDAWVTECLPDDPEWDEPVGGWYVMVRDDSDDEDGEADEQKIIAAEDAVRKVQGTPLMDTEDGSLYICTERGRDGTLYLGCGYPLGNAGLLRATYKIEYDLDRSLNRNLEDLMDELDSQGVRPYGEEEEEEDEDMEESRRPRGRMLRESSTAMPVHYVIGRELFDDKWWPIIVYLNESPDRYWYEAVCADEGGVYHTELGKGYLSRIRPGTDKCAPEVVEAVEDEFFGQFAVDDIPTRRVDTIEDLERYAPADKRLISRD